MGRVECDLSDLINLYWFGGNDEYNRSNRRQHEKGVDTGTETMRLTTLIHEMISRDSRYGLETICGGGQGICLIVERR